MVESPVALCVATRANRDSDHDRLCRTGAAVDTLGKRLFAVSLSGRPTASLRATPLLLLLHHVLGRQPVKILRGDPYKRSADLEAIPASVLWVHLGRRFRIKSCLRRGSGLRRWPA